MGLRRGGMAAAILATAPLYAVMAQTLTTDMLLTAMTTIAIFALFLHYKEGGIWCWIAYLAMALATLTKGPVGIAIAIRGDADFPLVGGRAGRLDAPLPCDRRRGAGARDRRAMVHRDQRSRAGLRRFLFHRRAPPARLRFIVQSRRAVLLFRAGDPRRIVALVAADAVSDLAQDAAQSGAPLLRDRRADNFRRLLRLERQADSVHPSGVSAARSFARRWNRCVRMAAGTPLTALARFANPDGIWTAARPAWRGRHDRGRQGHIVSDALCFIVTTRVVCDRRDPRVRRRDDDRRVFCAADECRTVVDCHHFGGGAMRRDMGAPRPPSRCAPTRASAARWRNARPVRASFAIIATCKDWRSIPAGA